MTASQWYWKPETGWHWWCVSVKAVLLSYEGSSFKVCQPLDCIIICKVKSAQTAIQLHQRAWVNHVRHGLGIGHSSTGLLDAISFYRHHNGPAVQYGNSSAKRVVEYVQRTTIYRGQAVSWWTPVRWHTTPTAQQVRFEVCHSTIA